MIKIVKFKPEYLNQVSYVIRDTYLKFCAKDATKVAVAHYSFSCDYKKNKDFDKNLKRWEIFFLAKDYKKIVGVIGGRDNHISNLYILKSSHGKGIGRKLLQTFEEEAKNKKWKYISIRSSLFGLPFYQKFGYKKTTGLRMFHGNKIQPIRKYL